MGRSREGCGEHERMKKKRGLAALSEEKRKEIASMGGKAAQSSGKGHRWNKKTAKAAAKKRLKGGD